MYNFIVKLRKDQKEELYSDESEAFMGFILIEALIVIAKAGRPDALNQLENQELFQEFPENQYDVSVDYLLEVKREIDVSGGLELDPKEYHFNSDTHAVIASKLTDAVNWIEDSNDPGELANIVSIFNSPELEGGFRFNAIHSADRIVFTVTPKDPLGGMVNATLQDLLTDFAEPSRPHNQLDELTRGVLAIKLTG